MLLDWLFSFGISFGAVFQVKVAELSMEVSGAYYRLTVAAFLFSFFFPVLSVTIFSWQLCSLGLL